MSKADLIFEIGTEEIPAGYMAPALEALEERLAKALGESQLGYTRIQTWATPRRLAVAAWGLAEQQEDTVKEVTGPPVRAAYDAEGRPTKAAEGFARGQGLTVDDLLTVDTPKGEYLAARIEIKGRPAGEVLAELLPGLILGLPFPKTMRWGKGEVVFVRPIHWILALLGGRVLPVTIGAIQAGNVSYGHRFLHSGPVVVTSPDDYESGLAEAHVIISSEKRRKLVSGELERMVAEAGDDARLLPDEELLDEVANLVEDPAAVCGRIDVDFLKLPPQVLTTAMREHQRYFALVDRKGDLKPFFIAVNNTRARDLKVVQKGHERVLRARLEDARFYFEDDRKTPLESKQAELKKVVFHTLLGTSWQKVERFRNLGEFLAGLLDPSAQAAVLRAAELCKCDLVTGVVGEFPSLQGIMGRAYALLDGESPDVAQAIYEHYLPNRAGGELPSSSAGALLGLADKLDTICGCFGVGLIPTGAADPYALRRQALGIINIILDRSWRVSLTRLVDQTLAGLSEWLKKPAEEARNEIVEFFRLRLKNQLASQGASTDGAEAVLALHHDDLVAAAARVQALEEIKVRDDFADLAVAFKRVVNIIRKFGAQDRFNAEAMTEEHERGLEKAVADLEKQVPSLTGADDYAGLLSRIVALKPAVDAFFDHVLVDDPNPEVKVNRLALLTRLARLFELVADFSKIST